MATVLSLVLQPASILTIPIALAIILFIHASNIVFLFGYDCWTDFSNSTKRVKLDSSEHGKRLVELINEVSANLNLL